MIIGLNSAKGSLCGLQLPHNNVLLFSQHAFSAGRRKNGFFFPYLCDFYPQLNHVKGGVRPPNFIQHGLINRKINKKKGG